MISDGTSCKRFFWVDDDDYADYCVLNERSDTFLSTDFMLGNQMTLEVCFKKTQAESTGNVLVGFTNSINAKDFRLFFADSRVFGDCGGGGYTSGVGARSYDALTDYNWHTVKFPEKSGSSNVMLIDGSKATIVERAYTTNGNWGTVSSPLCIFNNIAGGASQKAAIHYINVWRYNSDELLASFQPVKKVKGFKDIISGKSYQPQVGEISVVKWRDL